LEGWLSRITTNAFLDDVRRKQRRPVDSLGDDADRIVPAAMGADEALDASGLPEHLQQALADLPEEFRVCVVLCDVLGYGYAEIADRLDIPVGTVRSRISRGRSTLRGVLS
jgi:RNA polymerase sigma-70 factor (ECF subfamily)